MKIEIIFKLLFKNTKGSYSMQVVECMSVATKFMDGTDRIGYISEITLNMDTWTQMSELTMKRSLNMDV